MNHVPRNPQLPSLCQDTLYQLQAPDRWRALGSAQLVDSVDSGVFVSSHCIITGNCKKASRSSLPCDMALEQLLPQPATESSPDVTRCQALHFHLRHTFPSLMVPTPPPPRPHVPLPPVSFLDFYRRKLTCSSSSLATSPPHSTVGSLPSPPVSWS